MIRVFFTLSISLMTNLSQAQSITQLLQQLVFDTEKLASMKATLQQMYNGYTTLESGYTNIRDIAKGNFNLHQAFLDALLVISPAVASDPRIPTIINTEYSIVAGCQAANSRWSASGVFTPQELNYIIDTYSALLTRCMQSIEELTMVITADQLRMSDGQRIQAIARIDEETKQQAAMLQQLDNTLSIQTAQRQAAQGDLNTLNSIYGIPH